MSPAQTREIVVVVVHLALWSQLGVLTRIYLDRFFADGCSGSFGVCLTSQGVRHNSLGAYFPDLASNMLGSFIMGLLAASATLNLPTKKAMAILPQHSALQGVPELHIGMRTGFCGSLTTFASWEYSLVTALIGGQGKQGGQWAEFLWGLIVGLHLSLASYAFGERCALMVDRYLVPGGRDETDLERIEDRERETVEAERRGDLGQDVRGLDLDDFGTDQRIQGIVEDGDEITYVLRPDTEQDAMQGPATVVVIERQPGETAMNGSSSTVGREPVRGQHNGQLQPRACIKVGNSQTAHPEHSSSNGEAHERAVELRDVESGAGSAEVGGKGRGTGGTGSLNVAAPGQEHDGHGKVSWLRAFLHHDPGKYTLHRKTNLVIAALLALVLALFITLTVVDKGPSHADRRAQWLAILFGPFGCTLRWLLSKYNYKLPGKWRWLPFGTFAANMLACFVDYIVGGASHKAGHLGYWATIVLYAIRTGFCGALSTVSTFVAEIHTQLKLVPEVLHAYTYSIGSLLTAAVLGVLVYGSMVWSQ